MIEAREAIHFLISANRIGEYLVRRVRLACGASEADRSLLGTFRAESVDCADCIKSKEHRKAMRDFRKRVGRK